jgi:MFS family permease
MLAPTYPERRGIDLWDQVRLAVLASPVVVLTALLINPSLDPAIEVHGFHFMIVTLAAGISAVVALAVLAVADRLGDPRAFYVGLAFGAIAGFFFIHGLLTPGVVVPFASNGIGWAPPLALFLGAVLLALSTARPRPSGEPWVFRHRRAVGGLLFVLWVGFLAISLLAPRFLAGHPKTLVGVHVHVPDLYGQAPRPEHQPWIAAAGLVATGALLVYSGLRYAHIYRLSRLPLHATILAGIVLLIQSLLPIYFGTVWRLSWWGYHALILGGVGAILVGMVLDYRQGANLSETISRFLLNAPADTLERSYNEVLTALVAAVEARDPYTKGHSEKVARLAVQIGERLGLPPERLRLLHQAGLLHDVGKIGVPDGILNKPDRLTAEETTVVREHPLRSEEMISRIRSLRPTLRAVRWHHERLDGSGYPDRLVGDAIPLEARILAVADVFDAMSSGRSYRPAWPEQAVLAHLEDGAGRLYDSRCVQAIKGILASARSA